MRHVIGAWCRTDADAFEATIPLAFAGKRHQRLGYRNDIDVVFLSGFSSLSGRYRDELRALGYRLHDAQGLYDELARRYVVLDRFGDYEKKCFLRWLAFDRMFSGEKLVQLDGDVVLNECPSVIAEKLRGLTFVLQGCPALTAISDRTWFEQYRDALDHFAGDIDRYSDHAWKLRNGWETTFKTRWAGSRFRRIVTSDQDLLSHLIHTGGIRQDPAESVLFAFEDYVVFENPLLIHMYCETFPYTYSREKGIDYFSYRWVDAGMRRFRRRVLLWHMQTSFNLYASKYLLRSKLGLLGAQGRLRFSLDRVGLEETINRKFSRITHHQTRRAVYEYYFGDHDFRGLMRGPTWWQPGVFT